MASSGSDATIGLIGYLFEPFGKTVNQTPAGMLVLAYVLSLLLLPTPSVGGRPGETQAINLPAWSLMQEYLGNIAYALILRRLRAFTLAVIVVLAGVILIWVGNDRESLDGGWGCSNLWMAPLRLTVSFVMGLWLYRIQHRVRCPKLGLLLSLVLVAAFQIPKFPKVGAISLNGLYDPSCVLLLFPLILLCGAHSEAGEGMMSICKLSGRLSYPIYITHMVFVLSLANFSWTRHPGTGILLASIFVLFPIIVGVAWVALTAYDEPLRAWLSRRYGFKRTAA